MVMNERKSKKNFFSKFLLIIAILCFLAAGALAVLYVRDYLATNRLIDGLKPSNDDGYVEVVPEVMPTATPGPTLEPTPEPTPEPVEHPYKEAFLQNADTAAWIQVPGTVIDYPVMWTPADEEYYLYRGFDKKKNQNGCLILDTDSCTNPLSTNLIIHGHNMKSGAMFGSLLKYDSVDYYNEHKNIILYTEDVQRNYEIVAVFRSQIYKTTDQVFKFYKFFNATTQEEFDNFYNNIKAMSLYDTGVTAEFGDNFITLATCTYHVTNGRFVVVAKEVSQGDRYLPITQ